MAANTKSLEFDPCAQTVFETVLAELRTKNEQKENDLIQKFDTVEQLKKKEQPRSRINELKKISRELDESYENFTKTNKKIANKILEIVEKQKHIYTNKISLLKTKKIKDGICLEYIETILDNRLKDYNRDKRKKKKGNNSSDNDNKEKRGLNTKAKLGPLWKNGYKRMEKELTDLKEKNQRHAYIE